MTQTRESWQDVHYRKLAGKAHKLFTALNAEMDRVPVEDEGWRELHDLFKLSQVITSTLERYRDRQDAGNELDADLDAAIAKANPGHPLITEHDHAARHDFADTMLPAGEPVDYWPF